MIINNYRKKTMGNCRKKNKYRKIIISNKYMQHCHFSLLEMFIKLLI